MPFQASGIFDLLSGLIFCCLNNPSWINSAFRHVLQSQIFFLGVLAGAGLVFCPGLFEVVQHTGPPPVSWFESLPAAVTTGLWGIYVIVLRRDGCRPIIYIGSGTAAKGGIQQRFNNYNALNYLPKNVWDALKKGYIITHKGLLVSCPTPSAARVPLLRTTLIALEAAFSCIFSAMQNPDKHYGFYDLYPWPRSTHTFEYDGACSHSPFLESPPTDILLTDEQREEIAAAIKEKNRVYQQEYGRNLRTNPTDEYLALRKSNNEKQRPNTKANQLRAVATKQ